MQQASELREKNAQPAPDAVASNRFGNRTAQVQHLPIARDDEIATFERLRHFSMFREIDRGNPGKSDGPRSRFPKAKCMARRLLAKGAPRKRHRTYTQPDGPANLQTQPA